MQSIPSFLLVNLPIFSYTLHTGTAMPSMKERRANMDNLCQEVLEKLLNEYRSNHNKTIDVTFFNKLEHQALKRLAEEGFILITSDIADFVTLTDKALSE